MIDVTKLNINDTITHTVKGDVVVRGIHPHCGDYLITTDEGWVYLKNCTIRTK